MESIEGGKHPTTTNISLPTGLMPGLATFIEKESTISKCNLDPHHNQCCEVCECKCSCIAGTIATHHQTLECVRICICICKSKKEEYMHIQKGMLCCYILTSLY